MLLLYYPIKALGSDSSTRPTTESSDSTVDYTNGAAYFTLDPETNSPASSATPDFTDAVSTKSSPLIESDSPTLGATVSTDPITTESSDFAVDSTKKAVSYFTFDPAEDSLNSSATSESSTVFLANSSNDESSQTDYLQSFATSVSSGATFFSLDESLPISTKEIATETTEQEASESSTLTTVVDYYIFNSVNDSITAEG